MFGRKSVVFVLALLLSCAAFAGDNSNLEISGFVDASYSSKIDEGKDGFSLDQVEIDVIHKVDDNISLRADFDTFGSGDLNVEQAFLNYRLPMLEQVTWTFGQFNAPIGFEMLDAPDMYQYSHSLVFNHCLPTNLTGVMASGSINEMLDYAAYVVNGWDVNTENDHSKNVGGRLGINLNEAYAFGVSAIHGKDTGYDSRTVLDIDATLTPVEKLLIGAEFNMGMGQDLAEEDISWTGFMVMGHYTINDWLGATVRYDTLMDDEDNPTLGLGSDSRSSLTFAPTFSLGAGMGALIEYRMDMAGDDIFTDSEGKMDSSESTIALEITYTF